MAISGFPPKEHLEITLTVYYENKPGFSDDVDQQLTREIKQFKLSESRNYYGILVYKKFSGKIIGFMELGDVNDSLLRLEQLRRGTSFYVQTLSCFSVCGNLNFLSTHFGTVQLISKSG